MISDEATTPAQARAVPRRSRARSLTALAGVAVVGLLTAACGSSTPSASGTTSAPTTAAPAATTGTGSGQLVADAASNAEIGASILVNSSGRTLYRFSADSSGMSACTGTCATHWPPLTVPAGATPKGGSGISGTFATITRADGTTQVTYNGHPLYTFVGDTAAGSTSGQNLVVDGGTWTVVTVDRATAKSTTPPTTKPSSGGSYSY